MADHFINILKHEQNSLLYECSCGAKGQCVIKPTSQENAAIVVDIKCPKCFVTERLTLLQYNSEESKEVLLRNLNELDLSWVPTINEEIEVSEE